MPESKFLKIYTEDENENRTQQFARVTYTRPEERQKDQTILMKIFDFESEHRFYTIFDTPGDKKYIKSMFKGLS